MSDENTVPTKAPAADDAAKKAKRVQRKAEIGTKARDAATKSGKDWDTMSKEEKLTFRKAARGEMRAAATKRRARRAKRATAAKEETTEA